MNYYDIVLAKNQKPRMPDLQNSAIDIARKTFTRSGAHISNNMLEEIIQNQLNKDYTDDYNRRLNLFNMEKMAQEHRDRKEQLETNINTGAMQGLGTVGSALLAAYGRPKPKEIV